MTEKTYCFPARFARKDFPLLFPKSNSDNTSIRLIAGLYDVDYDGLSNELALIQRPVVSSKEFRRKFNHFKTEYKALFYAVQYVGEKYGIELNKYAIHKAIKIRQNNLI